MSAKIMGEVWDLDIAFNKAWVLMAMADHADHDGKNVFPRLEFVAWKTGYDTRTVRRIVAGLRDDGILIPCGYTPGGVVIYRIVLAHIARKSVFVAQNVGRPKGRVEKAPRNQNEKMGCQIVTPFCVTHNHQLPNSNSNSTNPEYLVTEYVVPRQNKNLENISCQDLLTDEQFDELFGRDE